MMPSHANHLPLKAAAIRGIKQGQQGAALFVVILVSMAVTLLGVQLVNQLIFKGRTAMWDQDVAVARLAAEAALRDAETDLLCRRWDSSTGTYVFWAHTNVTATRNPRAHCVVDPLANESTSVVTIANFDTVCPRGMMLAELVSSRPATSTAKTRFDGCNIAYGSFTGAPPFTTVIPGLTTPPTYSIEVISVETGQIGQATAYYRIRAKGFGRNPETIVNLESIFRPL